MSVTRRELLAGMGVVSLNAVLPVTSSAKSLTSDLRINPDRHRSKQHSCADEQDANEK